MKTNTHFGINQQQQSVSGETASWEDVCADFQNCILFDLMLIDTIRLSF